MTYKRPCKCPHRFPVCACSEGHAGSALDARSRTLSSLAGWPAPRIDADTVARVIAAYGRPAPTPDSPQPAPPGDCGCGKTGHAPTNP